MRCNGKILAGQHFRFSFCFCFCFCFVCFVVCFCFGTTCCACVVTVLADPAVNSVPVDVHFLFLLGLNLRTMTMILKVHNRTEQIVVLLAAFIKATPGTHRDTHAHKDMIATYIKTMPTLSHDERIEIANTIGSRLLDVRHSFIWLQITERHLHDHHHHHHRLILHPNRIPVTGNR